MAVSFATCESSPAFEPLATSAYPCSPPLVIRVLQALVVSAPDRLRPQRYSRPQHHRNPRVTSGRD